MQAAAPENRNLVLGAGEEVELQVTVLQPATHARQIQWSLDGATASSLTVRANELGNGNHNFKAKIRDATEWVRLDEAVGYRETKKSWL